MAENNGFVSWLFDLNLIEPSELTAFVSNHCPNETRADESTITRKLVDEGLLTPFQAAAIGSRKTKGLVIDKFVLLEKIGAGGMGHVFKARHRELDQVVAIKLLSTRNATPDTVSRFKREGKIAASLKHNHIVRVHDAGEWIDGRYIAMDFVEGDDFARVVAEQGALSVEDAITYTIQAAKALAYAHSKAIVHRDIKPSNLLLDQRLMVKVLDLGLARIDQTHDADITTDGQILGTANFIAPEQIDRAGAVDGRVDVYSLGCTLYFLLTAKAPFADYPTTLEKLSAHRHAAPPRLRDERADAPVELEQLIDKMLKKLPEERPPTMGDVVGLLTGMMPDGSSND